MRIQLNKVLVSIALLSFIFISYSGEAILVSNELKDIQETVKNFIFSFSVKDILENISPLKIIGLCITTVIFAILFRGLIFFMIIFGVLVMMFGSTEKVTDCLKEKFSFVKVKPNSEKDKN